jgi:hypothetical protein
MPRLDKNTISVYDVVRGNAAISIDDGKALFEKIDMALSKGVSVALDFVNIEIMTSTFLNEAIGQLYSKYTSEQLREHLKVENLAEDDRKLLIQVIERAKEYFKDRNKIEHALKDSFDDEQDS